MSLKFDTQYFLEWFDKHDDELLVMEPEEIARKAFLAGMEAAQQSVRPTKQSVRPTNGGLALRACVSAHCGWVGKESACITWKHAGDERMCPHCHDNTESIPLSAISG